MAQVKPVNNLHLLLSSTCVNKKSWQIMAALGAVVDHYMA